MLYQVVQSYVATEAMELTVERGNIVGVIKKHNPLGDASTWFVDDGCKLYLILYTGNILCVCGGISEPRNLVSFSPGYCFITRPYCYAGQDFVS